MILLFIILGFIAGISIMPGFWKKLYFGMMGIIIGAFVSVILMLIVAGLLESINSDFSKPVINKTEQLVTLQDNSSSGDFFLGSGSLNGKLYYTYYYKINDNEFAGGMLPYDEVSVKYIKDNSEPRIEYYNYEMIGNAKYWAVSLKGDVVIFIPDGSIKNAYNLDAK